MSNIEEITRRLIAAAESGRCLMLGLAHQVNIIAKQSADLGKALKKVDEVSDDKAADC